MPHTFLFVNGNVHAELGDRIGGEAVHVFLGVHVVHDAVVRGQAVPGLDAQIRSLGARLVPQPKIGHIGVGNRDGAAGFFRFEGDTRCHVGQEDGVVVKHIVVQMVNLAVLQREGFGFIGHEATLGQNQLFDRCDLGKFNIIVRKIGAVRERYIEAGVTADAERQRLISGVFYLEGVMDGVVTKRISQGVAERKGILRAGKIIVSVGERQDRVRLFLDRQIHAADEAVNGHVVALSFVSIAPLDQTAANGEEQNGAVAPVLLVTLPKIFGTGGFFNDGIQLCAVVVDGDFELIVFKNVKHIRISFFGRALARRMFLLLQYSIFFGIKQAFAEIIPKETVSFGGSMMKTNVLELRASIYGASSVVGYMERQGPIGHCFDYFDDKKDGGDYFGQDTYEKAESEMQRMALSQTLSKAELKEDALGAIFAGDLLNQCTGSAYGLLDFDVPYFGLYGACSTAAEGLILSSCMVTGGFYSHVASVVSSHNCTAERQYRTPLEYGGQRTPTAQWTVTGAGAFVLGAFDGTRPCVVRALPGIAVEKGITDTNNMGAAMAPAASDTLLRYFAATNTRPEDYDAIVTGDLGYEGGAILQDLIRFGGYDLGARYQDCGQIIFSRQVQDTHAGGSGCGCSAVVLASYLLPKVTRGEIRRLLLLGTGAMMSPASIQQGLAIPGIAHLVEIIAPSVIKEV